MGELAYQVDKKKVERGRNEKKKRRRGRKKGEGIGREKEQEKTSIRSKKGTKERKQGCIHGCPSRVSVGWGS